MATTIKMSAIMAALAIRNEDGTVDVESTQVRFSEELDKWVENSATENERIAAAVTEVFASQPKGKHIATPVLTSLVVARMNVGIDDYADTAEKIADYVRENEATYYMGKGKNGGVQKCADMSAEATEKMNKARAARAAKLAAGETSEE